MGSILGLGRSLWRRKWQSSPVILPGKSFEHSYPWICSSMRMVLEDAGGLCISSELSRNCLLNSQRVLCGVFLLNECLLNE